MSENTTLEALNVKFDHYWSICLDVFEQGGKGDRLNWASNDLQALRDHLHVESNVRMLVKDVCSGMIDCWTLVLTIVGLERLATRKMVDD